MRQTTIVKHLEVSPKWYLIDAKGLTLGRLATFIADHLRGKHKPNFTNNVNTGDYIVVINVDKVVLSAKKEEQKLYYSHTGWPGGLRTISAEKLRAKKPTELLKRAVKGMIPHTKLGRKQISNLYLYAGTEHKHQAQKPKKIEVK